MRLFDNNPNTYPSARAAGDIYLQLAHQNNSPDFFRKAIQEYRKAYALIESDPDFKEEDRIVCLHDIGLICLELGDTSQAISYLNEAYKRMSFFSRDLESSVRLFSTYLMLGFEALFLKNKPGIFLKEALEILATLLWMDENLKVDNSGQLEFMAGRALKILIQLIKAKRPEIATSDETWSDLVKLTRGEKVKDFNISLTMMESICIELGTRYHLVFIINENTSETDIQHLFRFLNSHPKWTSLTLQIDYISPEITDALYQALAANQTILQLEFNSTYQSDFVLRIPPALETRLKRLTSLSINNLSLDFENFKIAFLQLTEDCQLHTLKLQKLDFSNSDKDVPLGDLIAKAMEKNPQLRTLTLQSLELKNEDLACLAKSLEAHSLTSLSLKNNPDLDDQAAEMLATLIKKNKTLTDLDCGINHPGSDDEGTPIPGKITDKGAKALAEALKTKPPLKALSLNYQGITKKMSSTIKQTLSEPRADEKKSESPSFQMGAPDERDEDEQRYYSSPAKFKST